MCFRRGLALILLAFMMPQEAYASKTFDLMGYQDKDGAITVQYGGDGADPYFATKALILAKEGGMDITQPAHAWIRWLLGRQQSHGLFERYCRNAKSGWATCAATDADDIMQALWIELLYTMAPSSGIPDDWKKSLRNAQSQLASLYDSSLGVYQVSQSQPAHLFMDNVEIYAALRNISRQQERLGEKDAAALTSRQAEMLAQAIRRVFGEGGGRFKVSTQQRKESSFYPDIVAQIFPWLHALPGEDKKIIQATYRAWMGAYKSTWLYRRHEDYPWGVVAVAALNRGDAATARCWQANASPLRYGKRWNVLEEAAFQQVSWRLQFLPPSKNIPCHEG